MEPLCLEQTPSNDSSLLYETFLQYLTTTPFHPSCCTSLRNVSIQSNLISEVLLHFSVKPFYPEKLHFIILTVVSYEAFLSRATPFGTYSFSTKPFSLLHFKTPPSLRYLSHCSIKKITPLHKTFFFCSIFKNSLI